MKPRKPKQDVVAAAIKVLHKRVAKLEKVVLGKQGRPIGFQMEGPDVVHGDVIPQGEGGED